MCRLGVGEKGRKWEKKGNWCIVGSLTMVRRLCRKWEEKRNIVQRKKIIKVGFFIIQAGKIREEMLGKEGKLVYISIGICKNGRKLGK